MLVNISRIGRSKKSFKPDVTPGDEWKQATPFVLKARKADSLLVNLVAEEGIVNPIRVKSRGERFIVVDGNRRLDAALLCGLTQVPVEIVK